MIRLTIACGAGRYLPANVPPVHRPRAIGGTREDEGLSYLSHLSHPVPPHPLPDKGGGGRTRGRVGKGGGWDRRGGPP